MFTERTIVQRRIRRNAQPVSVGSRSVSQFAASSPILNPTTYLETLIRPTMPLT